MTEYVEPLRKKFIKSWQSGLVGLSMAMGTVFVLGNSFYELEDHDWNVNISDHRMEALADFNQGRTSLIEMQKESDVLSRKFDKAALLWNENTFSNLKNERDAHMDDLQNRSTEYAKAILRSTDIHEKDAQSLISKFNIQGLNEYSEIKDLTADKMLSRNEIRAEYHSDYGSMNNEDYNLFVEKMDDSEKYSAMGVGVFMGVVVHFMSMGIFCLTGIPEKWKHLPDIPKKDKPKIKGVKRLFRKDKRLEN